MERLDKIISATGKKSRREVREMVRQGRVLVDGKPAPAADMKVDPQAAVSIRDPQSPGRVCAIIGALCTLLSNNASADAGLFIWNVHHA